MHPMDSEHGKKLKGLNTMKHLISKFIILALLPVFGSALINPCFAKDNKTQKKIPVEITTPARMNMEKYTEISGTFVSESSSTFGAKVPGTIEVFFADEGHKVKKGQVLARLEMTDFNLGLGISSLQLAAAKTQVERAKTEIKRAAINKDTVAADLERIREVVKKGSLPKQKLDHAQNAYESAESAFTQAQLALISAHTQVQLLKTQEDIARKKLEDCKIIAPLDGIISARHANAGEWAMPGKPIFTVESLDPIEIKGNLSETYLSRLKSGLLVRITSGPTVFETTIAEIAPIADARQRTVEITVKAPNPGLKLKPGLFARMRVIFQKADNTLVIPATCLLTQFDTPHVFVVEDDHAKVRKITTGIKDGEFVEVVSGLNEDSQVVFSGQNQLVGSERVSIKK